MRRIISDLEVVNEIIRLESINRELLDALERYINIPILPDPGHETELINAINQARKAITKARGGVK